MCGFVWGDSLILGIEIGPYEFQVSYTVPLAICFILFFTVSLLTCTVDNL